MNLYVWNNHYSALAVAHAESVAEARSLLLEEIGSTDGSCAERAELIDRIKRYSPTIFRGKVAEFAIDEGGQNGTAHFS